MDLNKQIFCKGSEVENNMRPIKRIVNNIMIVLLHIVSVILLIGLWGCTSNNQINQSEQTRDYVVNRNSRKIHAPECPAVKQMNNKNKLSVEDTLLNLLKQDYIICRRCRAGIEKHRSEEERDRRNYKYLYTDDIEISASYEEYLDAIDTVSEWYVNHVPTYQSKIEIEPFSDVRSDSNYYREYELKDGKGILDRYKVVSLDVKADNVAILKPTDQVTRANENAISNYQRNYNNITFGPYLMFYPCEFLKEASDYNKAGDDCVRYLFSVFNKMDPQFTEKYAKLTGTKYSRTNAAKIASNRDGVAYGFINLGFKIYDVKDCLIDVNKDKIADGYIFKIDDGFILRKGDILAREKHVHIYLGDGIAVEVPHFGWGRVNRSYPKYSEAKIIEMEHGGGRKISLVNSSGGLDYYTRVYRYLGRSEEE